MGRSIGGKESVAASSAVVGCIVMIVASYACAQEIAKYVKIDGTGDTKLEIQVFDKILWQSGTEKLVHVDWSDKLGRPADLSRVDVIQFSGYRVGHAPKGHIGIDVKNIKEIVYWEQMAVARAIELTKLGDFKGAGELAVKLTEVNPKWEYFDPLATASYAKMLIHSKKNEYVDQGLKLLHLLGEDYRAAQSVEGIVTDLYIELARNAFKDHNYQAGHDQLQKLKEAYPNSDRLKQFDKTLNAEVSKRLERAKFLENQGDVRGALDLLAKTRRMFQKHERVKQLHGQYLKKYQILRIACYEDAGAFDPFNAKSALEQQISRLIFDSVFVADEAGREFFKGPVLESFRTTALGTEYEFKLKSDVMFNDGSKLIAEDCVTTIHFLKDASAETYDPAWDFYVLAAKASDPLTFTVKIRQCPVAKSLFTFTVASSKLATLPRRGQPASRFPCGTGPFQLSTKQQGSGASLTLVANPHFRGSGDGRPFIKEIDFRRYTNKGNGAATNDLERGELHVLTDPSALQLKRLQNAAGFSSRPFLSDSVWVLVFNHRNTVLQTRDLRRAIRLAIDREHILKQYFTQGILGVNHSVITGPFPPHSNAYASSIAVEPPDPEVARQIVKQLSPRPMSLKYPGADITIELAVQQIAKDLRAIGLDVVTESKLPNDLLQEVAVDHDFDMAYWRIDHNNILFNLDSLFDVRSEALVRGGTNFMGYDDDELTQLFEDLRREQTGVRIWNIQNRIHMHLHREVVMVPLWWLESYTVHTNRLIGKTPDGHSTDLPVSRRNVFRDTDFWYLEPSL